MLPPTMRAGSSSSRMIDFAQTLLPEPDSPTMPNVSPARWSKLTPSTARTGPASVRNQVRRSRTRSSTSAVSGMRIEPVAQAVADEVEAHHHRQDGEPGKRRHPPLLHQLPPLTDHRPPLGGRRHGAKAKEGQAGEHENRVAEIERHQHD